MAEEFGPWIEHDGKGCPAGVVGKLVQVELETPRKVLQADVDYASASVRIISWAGNRAIVELIAKDTAAWDHRNFGRVTKGTAIPRVVHYRLRRPDALRDLIDLVENLPGPALDTVPTEGVPA